MSVSAENKSGATRLRSLLLAACLIGSGLATSDAAFAQAATAQEQRLDDLLDRLHDKGILTDEDVAALKQRRSSPGQVATALEPAPTSPSTGTAPVTHAELEDLKSRVALRTDDGVGLQLGDVKVTLNGQVNAFYVQDSGGKGPVITGGLANIGGKSAAIRDGLVPGYLILHVTTQQSGFDIGAHVGLYPGITSVTQQNGANSPGAPVALASAGLDVRKVYMTLGREGWGEIKLGRDVGFFGADATFNDITFLGVGSPGGNAAPSNTTFGRSGFGIIYPDFMPQISYTTPEVAGFQASVGVFAPFQTTGRPETNGSPQWQAHLAYEYASGAFTGQLWASGLIQKHDAFDGLPSYTGRGFDVGGKLTYGPATLTGYYYGAQGIGTTGLFILPTDSVGRTRGSRGYYVQGTYKVGPIIVGGSYGGSWLSLADGEINPDLVRSNTSWIGQVRYPVTRWVNLLGEYIRSTSASHGGARVSNDTFAFGGVVSF